MNTLTEAQKGWIAGIIDGEGYVGLCISRSLNRPRAYYKPRVSVRMTDMHTIETLVALTGLGHIRLSSSQGSGSKAIWDWKLSSRPDIIQLLGFVVTYMVTKKPQATTLLGYCYIYGDESLEEDFYLKLKELNKTGVKKE